MSIDETLFKPQERAAYRLRALYRKHGYAPYRMGKFEEYDLYASNKDFLVSDRVITFTDTTGKLMALKPDVTLSIVKAYRGPGVERVSYDENVYRVSEGTHRYKEILQSGVECIGELTPYHFGEVLQLAAESLGQIAEDGCVLCVSHLGVAEALLTGVSHDRRRRILQALEEKNPHGLREACGEEVTAQAAAMLAYMAEAFGEAGEVLPPLYRMTDDATVHAALDELRCAVAVAEGGVCRVTVDLSLVGNGQYYNGLIFRGYIRSVPTEVLTGGRYDRLLRRMGKSASAIGFAVYLDRLTTLAEDEPYGVDVLLLFSPEDDMRAVARRVGELRAAGESVYADRTPPDAVRYGRIERFGASANDKIGGEREDER